MAKRFIDTLIFDDEWFCSLEKNTKLFFLYYITKCDHAGVLRLNKKLCEFQTGITLIQLDKVLIELDKCLVTVKQDLFFLPKYIKFQYPDFPKSSVKQQESAIKILKSINLWDDNLNSYLTVIKELPNSYDNDSVLDNVIIEDTLLQKWIKEKCKNVSRLQLQLTNDESNRILEDYPDKKLIETVFLSMENYSKLNSSYKSVNLTFRNWVEREKKKQKTLLNKSGALV